MQEHLFEEDLKKALRESDNDKVRTLRLLISSLRNAKIELRKKDTDLAPEEIEEVIRKEIKKRKDSIAEYSKAG